MVVKKIKKAENKKKDYLTILLEDMRSDMKLIAEGYQGLERSIGCLDDRMDRMEGKMDRMEVDISILKSDVSTLKSDVSTLKSDVLDLKSGQSQSLEYLVRIEEELQALKKDLRDNYETKGESKIWRDSIERRLIKLEKALA